MAGPGAGRPLAARPYRFWFLLRGGEAVLCLEPVTGRAWRREGAGFDLPALYQKQGRRVASVAALLAGNLF